jgi:hypothetical protein
MIDDIRKKITPENETVVREWLNFQSSENAGKIMSAGFSPNAETYEAARRHFNIAPVTPD